MEKGPLNAHYAVFRNVVGALNVHIKRHGGEKYLNAVNAFTRE